jgi:hypothetical protein
MIRIVQDNQKGKFVFFTNLAAYIALTVCIYDVMFSDSIRQILLNSYVFMHHTLVHLLFTLGGNLSFLLCEIKWSILRMTLLSDSFHLIDNCAILQVQLSLHPHWPIAPGPFFCLLERI